jgi:hypothetical protein
MKELGGVVAVYEIDAEFVTIAPEQLIFIKSRAVRVDTQPIPTVVTHEDDSLQAILRDMNYVIKHLTQGELHDTAFL